MPVRIFSFILFAVTACASAAPAAATDIHAAAREGDLETVRSIVQETPTRIDERDGSGDTPLHLAAFGGHTELARWLIESGADVRAVDYGGDTPLHFAAYGGVVEIARLLLQKGSPVDLADIYGNTPLVFSVYREHAEMIEFLHSRGADLHHANAAGQLPLHFAVRQGDLKTVELIVQSGGDVNSKDAYGRQPLFVAKANDREDVAKYLIEHGARDDFELGEPKVEKLAPDFTLLLIPFANRTSVGVLTAGNEVALIDTGLSTVAPFLIAALAKINATNITTIINTHLHADHNGANSRIDSTATVVSFETLEQMEADGTLTKSEAGMSGESGRAFSSHYSFRLGGTEIRIIPAPGMHSDSDVLVYLPASRVVCMGSLLISEGFPGVGPGSVDDYVEFLDTTIDVFPDGTRFVAGHGPPLDREELKEYRKMVAATVEAVRKEMRHRESVEDLVEAGVLSGWSQYGECPYLPYLTDRVWINAIYHTGVASD